MAKAAVDLFLNDFQTKGLKRLGNQSNMQEDFHDFCGHKDKPVSADTLRCLCWNISNPSIERAKKQVLWLKQQPFDVYALTETKNSEGCNYIENYFKVRGFHVLFPKPPEDEYGAMLISRHPFEDGFLSKFGSPRMNSIRLQGLLKDLEIANTYVPNNREKGKQAFLENLAGFLKRAPAPFIFLGDLNILEPGHIPHYPQFESWEYGFYASLANFRLRDAYRILNPNSGEHSWFGHTGNGYRFDHCFVSEDIVERIRECYYSHEPRLRRLSDHSGLVISFHI